jgi:hypothetical protein
MEQNATLDRCKAYLAKHYLGLHTYAKRRVEVQLELGGYDIAGYDVENAASTVVWYAYRKLVRKYRTRYMALLAAILWRKAIKDSACHYRRSVGGTIGRNTQSVTIVSSKIPDIAETNSEFDQLTYDALCLQLLRKYSGLEKQVLFALLFEESFNRKALSDNIGISERKLFQVIANLRESVEL